MSTEARDLSNHCIYLKNNALYNEASAGQRSLRVDNHVFLQLPMGFFSQARVLLDRMAMFFFIPF